MRARIAWNGPKVGQAKVYRSAYGPSLIKVDGRGDLEDGAEVSLSLRRMNPRQ